MSIADRITPPHIHLALLVANQTGNSDCECKYVKQNQDMLTSQ